MYVHSIVFEGPVDTQMDLFVVSWTGNNKTENYYEIFNDIDNAKILTANLKSMRKNETTSGYFRFLGRNIYYDFKKLDCEPYMEIKSLVDYY